MKNSLLLSVKNLTPNVENLVKPKQTQKSHEKVSKCEVYRLFY